jgi:hypothetical protein
MEVAEKGRRWKGKGKKVEVETKKEEGREDLTL